MNLLLLVALMLAGCQAPGSMLAPTPDPTPMSDAGPPPDGEPPPYQSPVVSTAAIDLGPQVLVLRPDTPGLQAAVDAIYARMESSQFGDERHAILLSPGTYKELHLHVGFYTQLAGLGALPGGVVLDHQSTVQVTGEWAGGYSTTNFWRSAENFRFQNDCAFCFMWAVSQAAPLRRVDVDHDLYLFEVGKNAAGEWASGGFLADSRVAGVIQSGSQQQWFTRNTSMKDWPTGVWNMVFAGTDHPAASNWTEDPPYENPFTVIPVAPLTREKPFLYLDQAGNYNVFVPAARAASSGPGWTAGLPPGTSINLNNFHVARPAADTAATINAQLALGKNLLLTPGIYDLDQPIRIVRSDTVVLGLGMATLRPTGGTEAMVVNDLKGVEIAGLLFDAGPQSSPALLRVGSAGTRLAQAEDPTTLSDLFFRVGGAAAGKADACLLVNGHDVILDNVWAWRADHGRGVGWSENPARNGVIVNGDRVTSYGLAVEHFQEYQTIWNGNDGRTYFYQSELPYDPPSQADWTSVWGGKTYSGWAAYKVGDAVTAHQAFGLGIYAVFINTGKAIVDLDHAIEVPPGAAGVKLVDATDLSIDGTGSILHTVNSTGGKAGPKDFATYPHLLAWPVPGNQGPPTLVIDQFNSSDRWNHRMNSLGQPITTQGGIYNLEGTTDLYFFYNGGNRPEGFTETIARSLADYTNLIIGIKGGAGGEQATLSLVLNDGADHTLSLAAYGPVTRAFTPVAVPLAAFGADLGKVVSLKIAGTGTTQTVRIQKIAVK